MRKLDSKKTLKLAEAEVEAILKVKHVQGCKRS